MSVNSLLYPNKMGIYASTINLSATQSGGTSVAPIITNSSVLCPNLYVERALYADSTGNISSPPFDVLNGVAQDLILVGLSGTDAEWQYPNVITERITITNTPSIGFVLTGIDGDTASWQAPGTITGNIIGDIIDANAIVVDDANITNTFIVHGVSTFVSNVNAQTINATKIVNSGPTILNNTLNVTGVSTFTGNVNAANLNSTHMHNTGSSKLDGAIIAGSTIAATGNISAPYFIGITKGAVKATSITGTSLAITGAGTISTTLGVTGAVTGGSFSTAGQLTSTVSTGTAPLVVSSTTRVSNLNADTCGTADIANALKSATTTVSVSSATAPTSGQVLTATGASTATWQTPGAAGAGMIKQIVSDYAIASFNSSGTIMDYTPSIPVITDGTQAMSLTITPTSASSYLKIEVQLLYYGGGGSIGRDSCALYKVGTTDALTMNTNRRFYNNQHNQMNLYWYIAAGSTSAQTFTVRCGNEHGYSMGSATNVLPNNYIMITEYLF